MSAVTSLSGRPRLRTRSSASPAVGAATSLPWQPDRALTRRSAHFAREVYSVWSARVGSVSRHLPADQVRPLLNEMQLYPTDTQVCEMLQCAQDCADRSSPAYLTFGEFCLFATELKRCYHRGVPRSSLLARKLERDGKDKKKRSRKMSKSGVCSREEVFLGGSCNPTTWRQDVAIPMLTSLGISYYNPQVEDWSVELVEQEHVAKQNAIVLFYVIDSQTRNVVGMIEAAAFAGARRKLVLVISPYQPGQTIGGEPVSQQEYEELSSSLVVLRGLVERQGIPVFSSIPIAVKCTAKILRDNISLQDLVMADLKQHNSTTNGHVQVAEKLFKLREAFNNRDTTGSGHISLADVCMAYRLMTNRKLSVSELKGLVSSPSDSNDHPIQVNFEEFCAIIAELKSGDTHNNNNGSSEKWALCSRPLRSLSVDNTCLRDVLLAGDAADLAWAHTTAIPSLKSHSLSYHLLAQGGGEAGDLTLTDNCFALLFVITGQSRSLPIMAMASHYIGLGCNVVLCIQHIAEGLVLNGEKMSKQAVSDYNRGRVYLKDIARQDGVPVLQTVDEAVACVIDKCNSR